MSTNATHAGVRVILPPDSERRSAPQGSITSNDQLFLSNPAIARMMPQPESMVQKTKELVDFYIVQYPESSGASGEAKYMVIESQQVPKYHKILATFPNILLQYDLVPQLPHVTGANRENELTKLKDGTLAAYIAQLAAETTPQDALGVSDALFPRQATCDTLNGQVASESGDIMDFGGFFPAGTSFIANEVVFIGDSDCGTPDVLLKAEPRAEKKSSSELAAVVAEAASASISLAAPVRIASQTSPIPLPLSNGHVAGKAQSFADNRASATVEDCNSVMEVSSEGKDYRIANVCNSATVVAQAEATPDTISAAISATSELSSAAMDFIPLEPISALVDTDKVQPAVAAIEGGRTQPCAGESDVPTITPFAPLSENIEKDVVPPAIDPTEPIISPSVTASQFTSIKVEGTVIQRSDKPQPTKRSSEAVIDLEEGLQNWKKICLSKSDKFWPTLDEATDLFRNVPFSSYDSTGAVLTTPDTQALKRDIVDAKDLKLMIVSLTQAAKNIQKKSKQGGKENANGPEGDRQSIWAEAEENESNSVGTGTDSSSKAQVEWVQCDSCKKWRTLPAPSHPKYPSALDDDKGWTCSMNLWAPHLANCQVPEESMLSPTAIKIRVWLRRLRTGDRYESRNNLKPICDKKNAGTTNIKTVPVDWIRCCSPLCGKWRACLRTMSAEDVKNAQYPWFCWMGSWDETKATCSAPQEGFGTQGFSVAITEIVDSKENASVAHTMQVSSISAGVSNGATTGGGVRRANHSRNDNSANDETTSNADTAETGEDDDTQPTIGISSRGRIVRSKFNVRKHLANSKKQTL